MGIKRIEKIRIEALRARESGSKIREARLRSLGLVERKKEMKMSK